MSSINDDFFNQDIERLPRVIFYTNLFIFKSPEGKEKISLVKKQKIYGFDEADDTFYINNGDVIINKNDSVPFIKTMTFDLYNEKADNKIHYKENDINSKIILKKNSFVYMEVKLSFPLKFDENTGKPKDQNLEDFYNLIRSIIRKSKKFCEIAIKKEKKVEQIHILLFYDFMIQSNQYTQRTLDIFKEKIFSKIEIKLEKITKFEVIFFVNPSTINMRKFSQSLVKKISEIEKKNNELIEQLKKENKEIGNLVRDLQSQIKILQNNKKIENNNLSNNIIIIIIIIYLIYKIYNLFI